MEPIALQLVFSTQQILQAAGVVSAVTGDFGMSYHGVDIVVHVSRQAFLQRQSINASQDIELCVMAAHRAPAVEAFRVHAGLYEELASIADPNFYHPYKKGAARFKILNAEEPFELHIVTNDMLGLHLIPSALEAGLATSTASPEILDLCRGVSDTVLQGIVWPTLATFLDGWLHLAGVYGDSEVSIIYLMQAERLIDANDIDDVWCERTFRSASILSQAKYLLGGKKHRKIMSTWD
jgi:hypothetical protein